MAKYRAPMVSDSGFGVSFYKTEAVLWITKNGKWQIIGSAIIEFEGDMGTDITLIDIRCKGNTVIPPRVIEALEQQISEFLS